MCKKILIVGFFDLFHSGHVEFLKNASKFGDLYVSIATDENSIINKNKSPIYTELERKFMVDSCKYVKNSYISYGRTDILSFEPHLKLIKPDIINEDGHTYEKEEICKKYNVEYKVLKRNPNKNLPCRSSSQLRNINKIPSRIDLVSFFDQPILNSITDGSVLVGNIEPLDVIHERSGMCSSTIKTINKLFGNKLPNNIKRKELARIIFEVENMNNTDYISGSVDHIGICYRGIIEMKFKKNKWPYEIKTHNNDIHWLNKYLYLVHTKHRPTGFNMFNSNQNLNENLLRKQNEFVKLCLKAISEKNIIQFGNIINQVHFNQKKLFPNYESKYCKSIINEYKKSHMGCKLMGAGGYGYILVITDKPEKNFIKINITL